jgi:hypothetical protein
LSSRLNPLSVRGRMDSPLTHFNRFPSSFNHSRTWSPSNAPWNRNRHVLLDQIELTQSIILLSWVVNYVILLWLSTWLDIYDIWHWFSDRI